MKSWRGVPVLLSVLSGWVVGCGPVPEGGVEVGGEVATPELEAAVASETAEAGQGRGLVASDWEVCDDAARPVREVGTRPQPMVEGNGRLFFSVNDAAHGHEPWVAQGASRHTSLVKDVYPGTPGSVPRYLTAAGRWVFFVANDGEHGPELWRTDGTEKGTVLVKDIHPGPTGSSPEQLTAVGDTVYFTAQDGEHGRELWRSDGTARGTVLVHDFAPGAGSLGLQHLTAWQQGLALVSNHFLGEAVLWGVDKKGRVRRLFTLDFGAFQELEPAGRQLFFSVDPGTDEADLWVTRDTPGTATWLYHFPGQYPTSLTALGDAVYFVAGGEGLFGQPGDVRHGSELWTSDGTMGGTRMVRDINPGSDGSFSSYFTPQFVTTRGLLYFAADDGALGREPWRSDGTPGGTWLVRDLQPGEVGSDPQDLAADNGWVFFSADTSGHGREAWSSGGRFWNTAPLADLAPGAASSDPRNFVRAGWDVYFHATNGLGAQTLYAVPFRPARSCGDRLP
jgi:ELWxxDGT repeat protein